jgi:hypothetical protein
MDFEGRSAVSNSIGLVKKGWHFALGEEGDKIASLMRDFLRREVKR